MPLLLLLFVSTFAFAGPSHLLNRPSSVLVNEIAEFRPATGFHFALHAPQHCAEFKLQQKSPDYISCQISKPGKHLIRLNICENGGKICTLERFEIEAKANGGKSTGSIFTASKPAVRKSAAKKHSDFLTDFKAAQKLAQKKGALLFLDFFGEWCPPCNILDEMVFARKEFLEATKDMVRVRIDVDEENSWNLVSRFKVVSYPTVIITNANLEEIGRLDLAYNLEKFLAWIAELKSNRSMPLKKAELALKNQRNKHTEQTVKLRQRLGIWYYQNQRYAKAIETLKPLSDAQSSAYRTYAENKFLDEAGKTKEANENLKKLIQSFPLEIDATDWIATLADRNDGKVDAALIEIGKKNLEYWKSQPVEKLSATGYYEVGLIAQEAYYWNAVGDKDRAQKSYLRAAKEYEKLAKESPLETARGANLRRATMLVSAEKFEEAKEIYKNLSEHYAQEYTFNFGYAKVLLQTKDLEMAMLYAKKAYEYSYGSNRLRTVGLIAKVELAQGNKKAAVERIEKALSELKLPATPEPGMHWVLAEVRRTLTEAQK